MPAAAPPRPPPCAAPCAGRGATGARPGRRPRRARTMLRARRRRPSGPAPRPRRLARCAGRSAAGSASCDRVVGDRRFERAVAARCARRRHGPVRRRACPPPSAYSIRTCAALAARAARAESAALGARPDNGTVASAAKLPMFAVRSSSGAELDRRRAATVPIDRDLRRWHRPARLAHRGGPGGRGDAAPPLSTGPTPTRPRPWSRSAATASCCRRSTPCSKAASRARCSG